MNIYDKYGGTNFWAGFLNKFYSKIIASPLIRQRFANKNVSQIKSMLLNLLETLLVSYTHFPDEMIAEVHKHEKISINEFDEWIYLFRRTLSELDVEENDNYYIIEILSSYKNAITSKH